MKNLNPMAGIRQMVTGYFCVSRLDVIDLVRQDKLKAQELGYFFIFLTSTDWDSDVYRKGFIRHDLKRLSKIWNIPSQTLRDNLKKLMNKKVLIIENETPKIKDFDSFTYSIASQKAKEYHSDEFLTDYFKKTISDPGTSLELKQKVPNSFKTSFKNNNKHNADRNKINKVVVIRQEMRTDEEYQKMYEENPNSLLPEDMKWIDKNIEEKIMVQDSSHEKQIIDIYFDGSVESYKKHLIL